MVSLSQVSFINTQVYNCCIHVRVSVCVSVCVSITFASVITDHQSVIVRQTIIISSSTLRFLRKFLCYETVGVLLHYTVSSV